MLVAVYRCNDGGLELAGVKICIASEPAFQVWRYGYSAKLPLSILTNFEEFAVYDIRIKPEKTDDASVARIFYCLTDEEIVALKN